MSVAGESRASSPAWSGDVGAQRLFAHVQEACGAGSDFPIRLEAGLRAAIELLAAEPELAYELTVAPHLGADAAALDGMGRWLDRFGELLRDAAADDPRASREPSFIGRFLVDSVRFQIGRLILSREGDELPRLLPRLLEGVLSYYFRPGEPRTLVNAVLARR